MVNELGKAFVILLCSLVFWGCFPDLIGSKVPEFIDFDTESFNREWAAWEAQGLTDYSMDEDFLIPGVKREIARIVVQDNVIIQKETLDKWDGLEMQYPAYYTPPVFEDFKTISEIYAWVNRVYEETVEQYTDSDGYGISIFITYNKEFHYPELVSMAGWRGALDNNIRLSEFIPVLTPEEEEGF